MPVSLFSLALGHREVHSQAHWLLALTMGSGEGRLEGDAFLSELVGLPLLGCLSLHELGSSQAAPAGTLTPDSWLRVVHSGNLTSSLCPYSLMGEIVASCCHFTIPCSASHPFQHLGKQFPVSNDLGLKHLTGPN